MKLLKLILVLGGFLACQLSFAGIKESGGDENVTFISQSPENVDSALTVIGFGDPYSQMIGLKINVAETEIDSDSGILGSGESRDVAHRSEDRGVLRSG